MTQTSQTERSSFWGTLFGGRNSELWRFVRRMALRAGDLGVASADIAGRVEDVADRLGGQVERLKQVNFSAGEMAISNLEIHEIAHDATKATRVMHDDMTASQSAIRQALDDVFALTEGVKSIEERLPGLQKALKQVGAVSNDIDRIARKTDLLALNAAIEAARAGEAGKGFAVVADEVQALSRQTAAAVTQIQTTIQALSGQVAQLIAESGAASGKAEAARQGSGVIGHAIAKLDRVGESIADVEMLVTRMSSAASENMRKCQGVVQEVHAISNLEEESQADMEIARGRAMTLLKMSEDLISLTAETGVETVNTPYINATLDVARRIEQLFERAIDSGRIGLDELFDENYIPQPGVEPTKYIAAFTDFLEEMLPPIIEPASELTPLVVLCTVVDRNGYMPVHNQRYSQPPRHDPVWNAKHSRNRIMLKDRTAAAANACEGQFLLQTYRRYMGDHFQVLKDCAAPITVRGRRWGVARMCFKHDEQEGCA